MRWLCAVALLTALAGTAQAEQTTYVSSPYVDLRYRNATLDSDNFDKTGHVNTLRLQLGYLWAFDPNWAAYVEGTRVWSLFGHQYEDSTGRFPSYPSETDPESSEISSAWVDYHNQWMDLRAGRQYIDLDNRRFISVNPWRQNSQSFDALTSKFQLTPDTVLIYDWLRQVNRTVGESFPDYRQRRWRLNGHLLHLDQTLPLGKLSVYAYFIRNNTLAANSVRTLGGRWTGSAPLAANTKLTWTAEIANQTDYANNPAHFSLPYHLGELAYGLAPVSLQLGEESLGGNGRNAINTAYGSTHSFDGWVGEFRIPARGLRDRYGGLVGVLPWHKVAWRLIYHDFARQDGSQRYGDEIDVGALGQVTPAFSLEVQYGNYHAHTYSVDEHKLWLLADYKFGKRPN